jgi:ABC-type nickel/cobalt efflux system permease component RcnA
MEIALRILQDLVALVLASTAIGTGVLTALGDIRAFRQPVLRLIASVLFVSIGLWVFYTGIRHIVSG